MNEQTEPYHRVRAGVVSRILSVSHPTVKKLVQRGLLRVAARTPGGQALFDLRDVQALGQQLRDFSSETRIPPEPETSTF